MKPYIKQLLFVTTMLLSIACNNNSQIQKEQELREKEIALEVREKEVAENETKGQEKVTDTTFPSTTSTPPITKGYVLAVFIVSIPKLIHTPEIRGTYPIPTIPESHSIDHSKFVYCSDVIEADISDENELYKILDHMQNKIQIELTQKDNNFQSDVFSILGGPYPKLYSNEKCKILERKTVPFTSYKEASIYKQEHVGKY